MSKEKAVEIFSQVPKTCNCAQAVAAGFGREELLTEFAMYGGGRAPKGCCGALYAALELLPAEQHETIRKTFAAEAGSEKCVEIKAKGYPCKECVALAAELVEKYR